MYNYPHYKEQDPEAVYRFMQDFPFVNLIGTNAAGRTELTQVPVLTEKRENKIFISGHIARKSTHHQALQDNPEALVIYTGPHCYVSGSWYTGNPYQGSTWNYISVHARGTVRWMREEEMTELLRRLSLHFENGNKSSTTYYDNLPAAYLDKLLTAIVGFEIEVRELDNVLKLSQNRDELSYDNIIRELDRQEGDARTIAGLMKNRKPLVYPAK